MSWLPSPLPRLTYQNSLSPPEPLHYIIVLSGSWGKNPRHPGYQPQLYLTRPHSHPRTRRGPPCSPQAGGRVQMSSPTAPCSKQLCPPGQPPQDPALYAQAAQKLDKLLKQQQLNSPGSANGAPSPRLGARTPGVQLGIRHSGKLLPGAGAPCPLAEAKCSQACLCLQLRQTTPRRLPASSTGSR